jgi:hypothetical protein
MARRVFFSFHYDKDIWRANQVRNANVVVGSDVAGFFDHSEYDEAKKTGKEGIKRMILSHLKNTSVTVVLIGTETASRPWVKYEIEQSVAQNNGLLGIYIHHLKNQNGDCAFFEATNPPSPMGWNSRHTIGTVIWIGSEEKLRPLVSAPTRCATGAEQPTPGRLWSRRVMDHRFYLP